MGIALPVELEQAVENYAANLGRSTTDLLSVYPKIQSGFQVKRTLYVRQLRNVQVYGQSVKSKGNLVKILGWEITFRWLILAVKQFLDRH